MCYVIKTLNKYVSTFERKGHVCMGELESERVRDELSFNLDQSGQTHTHRTSDIEKQKKKRELFMYQATKILSKKKFSKKIKNLIKIKKKLKNKI